MSTFDSRSLRDVLGCFATGVVVVTVRTAAGGHTGVTMNSFSSVSLDPPLILFSLARKAGALHDFQDAQGFAANILSHLQEGLSNTFARPSSANWDEVAFVQAENGCALLMGVPAHLECSPYGQLDGGDHIIFVCKVERVHLHADVDPLVFYRGRYGTFTRAAWEQAAVQNGTPSEFSARGRE